MSAMAFAAAAAKPAAACHHSGQAHNRCARLRQPLAATARLAAPAAHPQLQQQRPRQAGAGWQQRRRGGVVAVQQPERNTEVDSQFLALTEEVDKTAASVIEGLQGTTIFLVGMMGSGKSTVGRIVAKALAYCFFDTDALIEQLSGKAVSAIFAEEGEEEFRELETQVLAELAPFRDCVIATGGGVPTRAENWGHMQGGVSVWLNGPPSLLAHRVVGEGTELRPLLSQGAQDSSETDAYRQAVERLSSLLEERRPCYETADIVVSLEGSDGPGSSELGANALAVAYRVLKAIDQRIKDDAEERQRRMDFEIVEEKLPSSMRVMPSPAAQAAAAAEKEDPYLP